MHETSLNTFSNTRRTISVLLFLAIAATAWLLMHQSLRVVGGASHHDVIFNPGYQHAQRLEVASARAAMDALGMTGTDQAASYQADYRLQRMQIQADSAGLERWAVHDAGHQGLLREIRDSVAALLIALDQTTGSSTTPTANADRILLLPALNRAHSALSNYSASLTTPTNLQTEHYLFVGPVLLWWLLILLLTEVAALALLVFSMPDSAN
jgi:hypothetical protein